MKKTKKFQKIPEVVLIFAHKLRDPISALKGYIEILLSQEMGPLTLQQREYLEDALSILQRLDKTVDDFFRASRLETDYFELHPQKIKLEKLTQEIIQDFSAWAKAHNCQIIFEKEENLPLVFVDPLRIREVIESLLSNAIKYSDKGGKIIIKIFKKNNELVFECQDFGIGISENERSKLFEKFFRSEKAIALNPEGSGLGLFVAKKIIELSGGKIWYEPNKPKGSIFAFSLPVK